MAKGRYTIVLWPLAETELGALRSFDRRRIEDAIKQQLQHDPFVATRNRKPLPGVVPVFEHEKPVWELRVGEYRVFYEAAWTNDAGDYAMKAIPIEVAPDAAKELKKATKEVPSGYYVLTRGGKAIAYILPTSIYDEEDIGYMTDPEFWKMIAERRKEKGGIPLEQIEAKLRQQEKAESRIHPAKKARRRSRPAA